MHYADRVQETTTTTGTGTVTLAGAVSGYRAFSAAFSDGDTVRYAIVLGTDWEVGEGVYSAGTITRATVFASSNSNALVSFSAGAKAVWCDIPAAALSGLGSAASNSVLYRNASGNVAGSGFLSVDEAAKTVFIDTAQSTVMQLTNYAGSNANGSYIMLRKSRGSSATPTKILSGDFIGGVLSRGYFEDGTPGFGPSSANSFRFVADEDFTSTTQGTSFALALSKVGAASAPEVFRISGNGYFKLTPQAAATGSIPTFTFVAAAHTGQTSAELNEVLWNFNNTITFATGNISTMRTCRITPRTYAFAASSTITTAATFTIGGAPIAGTNCTITNPYALWIQGGSARLDGGVDAATTLTLAVDKTTQLDINATNGIRCALPVVGLGTAWGSVNGMFTKSLAGASYDLAATEYNQSIIKVTGTGSNTIRLPPATDAQAYTKYIWNAGSGTLAVKDTNNVTASATLAAGTGAQFLFAGSAVKQLAAAFTVA